MGVAMVSFAVLSMLAIPSHTPSALESDDPGHDSVVAIDPIDNEEKIQFVNRENNLRSLVDQDGLIIIQSADEAPTFELLMEPLLPTALGVEGNGESIEIPRASVDEWWSNSRRGL